MRALTLQETFDLTADLVDYAAQTERSFYSVEGGNDVSRERLVAAHEAAVSNLRRQYKQQRAGIMDKTVRAINEAGAIVRSVNQMDEKLYYADKYYARTREKKEHELAERKDALYDVSRDAFETLGELQAKHTKLVEKYTNDILPGLLDGLSYVFSSKRRKEYEEIIVLKNTAQAFYAEIRVTMPVVRDEICAEISGEEQREISALTSRQQAELEKFDAEADLKFRKEVVSRMSLLQAIMPEELSGALASLYQRFLLSRQSANTAAAAQDGIFDMAQIMLPFEEICFRLDVAKTMASLCAPIVSNGVAGLPLVSSEIDSPMWYLVPDGSDQAAVQDFIQSAMFSFLANVPVGHLKFHIIDPENRGNSVAPFFDARKKLPELFGETICTCAEQINATLDDLNAHIEDTLQNVLGNRYENVFEYARENDRYALEVKFLAVFDFPRGFDDRAVSLLRNVLRNGRRAGVYVAIAAELERDDRFRSGAQRNVESVKEIALVAQQEQGCFFVRGLPCTHVPMPDKASFAQHFNKYLLIYERIQNRGIAFSDQMRRLSDAQDDETVAACIAEVLQVNRKVDGPVCAVPVEGAAFAKEMPIGKVAYPADLFEDAYGQDEILRAFGTPPGSGARSVSMPLSLSLERGFALYLDAGRGDSRCSRTLSHKIIWSFFSNLPPTKAEVCVIDCEERGNSIMPFLGLKKAVPDAFNEQIATSQEGATALLKRLSERIDELIQDKLGNDHANILAYNEASPRRAESLQLLVVYDFPAGLDGRALSHLQSIIKNGGKCGISVVICGNDNIAVSGYGNAQELADSIRASCSQIRCSESGDAILPYNLPLATPSAPAAQVVDEFVAQYARICNEVKKKGISFGDILPASLYSCDSSSAIEIPIGVGDGDAVVNLTMGKGSSHHCLIAGATGSGKSTLYHTLIMSALLSYSPDQLHLYLMDFKGGTEFKVYESVPLPHIQLLALDAVQEFGESILEDLIGEMEQRSRLFKEAGQSSLKDYVRVTGRKMPRILVIMDEFQILFNYATNRKVANNCAELAKRIVTEGRSYGIHLFMATQSTKVISDLTLSRGTIEQMRIRIGLKCGDTDARYLFTDRNERRSLELMRGPIGTAVINEEYMEGDCIGFRVAYCDDASQEAYLRQISEHFANAPAKTRVFEGSRVTPLLDYFASQGIAPCGEQPARIHLGDLIKVAPPFSLTLDKRHRHNLLICGTNERMAGNLVELYLISALMNTRLQVLCVDGDYLLGYGPKSDFYRLLERRFPGRFILAEDDNDIFALVNRAYEALQGAGDAASGQQTVLVFKDFQFLDQVKTAFKGERVEEPQLEPAGAAASEPDLGDGPDAAEDPNDPFAAFNAFVANRNKQRQAVASVPVGQNVDFTSKLLRIVDLGSSRGVFTVVSSLEYQSVNESMRYGERVLSKFPERIIFSLGENDAYLLIDNVSLASLKDNTVYFTDGVRNTFQLKPYGLPSVGELDAYLGRVMAG